MKSFLLHAETDVVLSIPFEEIMFLTSIKTNMLSEICDNVFIVNVVITDAETDKIEVVTKIEANNGEFAGYSSADRWETALSKSFDNIFQQIKMLSSCPIRENAN